MKQVSFAMRCTYRVSDCPVSLSLWHTFMQCSTYMFDAQKPVTPPPQMLWDKKLGDKPFFAQLEFILDWLADGPCDTFDIRVSFRSSLSLQLPTIDRAFTFASLLVVNSRLLFSSTRFVIRLSPV